MKNTIFFPEVNDLDVANIVLSLLKEGTKSKVSDLLDIEKIKNYIQKDITILFDDIVDTDIDNIKIGKSKVDGKQYFINIDDNKIIHKGFYEIIEIIKLDGRIVFQACDSDIDGLYAYYDFDTGEIISKKSDRRIYGFINN